MISLQVISTSHGLTKTVYNPDALKAGQKGVPFGTRVSTEDALKRKQVCVIVLVSSLFLYACFGSVCELWFCCSPPGGAEASAGRQKKETGDFGEAHSDSEGASLIVALLSCACVILISDSNQIFFSFLS